MANKIKIDFSSLDKMYNDPGVGKMPEVLLSGSIPMPLHGMSPRELLGKTWWNKRRKQVYRKYSKTCVACGTKGRVEAHEIYIFNWDKCSGTLINIVALCSLCHGFIHIGFTARSKGNAEAKRVYERGLKILNKAKLYDQYYDSVKAVNSKNSTMDENDWSKWYMEINGEKFYTKHKNKKEWKKYYGNS